MAILLVTGGLVRGSVAPPLREIATTPDRPFEHRRHEVVSCTACHGTGEQHRTMLIRTARDCAACHHDEKRGLPCTTCHEAGALPQARPVAAAMVVANADTASTRVLTFAHARHVGLSCRSCHEQDVTLGVTRGCTSCHEQHHGAAASCTSCHTRDVRTGHTAESHLTCGGAGCHERRALPERTQSRTLCLACHREQAAHEPDGSCASCHRIPARVKP